MEDHDGIRRRIKRLTGAVTRAYPSMLSDRGFRATYDLIMNKSELPGKSRSRSVAISRAWTSLCLLMLSCTGVCASYKLTLNKSEIAGDTTQSIQICVKDVLTNQPYVGGSFTGGVYFYNFPGNPKATIAGVQAKNTYATIPGQTGSNGCLTIGQIVTSEMIPTREYSNLSFAYAYLLLNASFAGAPGGASANVTVHDFTYTVTYTPVPIISDGSYPVTVKATSVGSGGLSGIKLYPACTSQSAPILSTSPQTGVAMDAGNKSSFTLIVASSLIADPSATSQTYGTCYFSWYQGYYGAQIPVNATNTCLLALSPGDPNCGPRS